MKSTALKRYFDLYPKLSMAVVGGVLGAVIGLLVIGNFGVASAGTAFSVYGWMFGAALGGYIGFRIGEWRERKRHSDNSL
jgi:uncharacterized protein YcfJ